MDQAPARGRHKIYFGYLTGVGKTYRMLEDAFELRSQQVDVVIGFLGSNGAAEVAKARQRLELIAPLVLPGRLGPLAVMDVDAILLRNPRVCLVDELVRPNALGAPRSRCWEDVQVLLEAGIDVLSTMNVQDLASLSDRIWQLTGLRVRETVPDWIFQQADEVIMVDVTPRALLHRLERGAISPREYAQRAPVHIFEEPILVALRELAIRQTAQALEARRVQRCELDKDRILVNITADPSTAILLRRARRVADYLQIECMAVHVETKSETGSAASRREVVERHLRFARDLHIPAAVVQGSDAARALLDYARSHDVTELYIGRPVRAVRPFLFGKPDFTDRLVLEAARSVSAVVISVIACHGIGGAPSSPYPEDEAASLMHSGYIAVRTEMTVEEAISQIRRQAGQLEMIYYAYVLDAAKILLGVVSFRELLSAGRSRKILEIMRTDYVAVLEDDDKIIVARVLAERRLLALPVLDHSGHMLGIVTNLEVAGLVQQKAGADLQRVGGMEALDAPYLDVTLAHMLRKRAGWLAILFVGETLTASAMGHFSDMIGRAVVLALFLPLIISSGGNSGSQATTLVIRAMAMGEIGLADWWRVVRRELAAGVMLGAILGAIGIFRIIAWHKLQNAYGPHYVAVALTIALSLIGVVTFGTMAGSMLPFILRRCGLDPASASAPFVATLVDVSGLIIYFNVASYTLRGTLL